MKRLYLLRHAKSEWSSPDVRDFDRPINDRGRTGALLIGKHLAEQKTQIDLVLASPAVRVVETIDQLTDGLGQALSPQWDRRIYLASSVTLADVISDQAGEADHVLMVGHNPGLEDLILDLVPDDGSSPLRDTVEEKLPTAAWAELHCAIESWSDLANGCASLHALVCPRDLDPALGPEMD